MHDMIEFTHCIDTPNLISYLIKYIDQHVIAYNILRDASCKIYFSGDECANYLIDESSLDKETANTIKQNIQIHPTIYIFGETYSITFTLVNSHYIISIRKQ